MNVHQKTIKVFEFLNDDDNKIMGYLSQNLIFLKNSCMAFNHAIGNDLMKFLESNNLNYFIVKSPIRKKEKNNLKNVEIENKNIDDIDDIDNNSLNNSEEKIVQIFDRQIRSGEEIEVKSNAIFTKDIHDGAVIKCHKNVTIFGRLNSKLEVLGDYILLKKFNKGKITLKGISVERKLLEKIDRCDENNKKIKDIKGLNFISIENGEIKVKYIDI